MTKEARKQLVKAVAEQRAERQMTFWISRDRNADGSLSAFVDVWLVLPQRVLFEGGVGSYYRVPEPYDPNSLVQSGAGLVKAHYGTWTIPQCLKEIRVIPDDDLQVIRVGNDAPPQLEELSE